MSNTDAGFNAGFDALKILDQSQFGKAIQLNHVHHDRCRFFTCRLPEQERQELILLSNLLHVPLQEIVRSALFLYKKRAIEFAEVEKLLVKKGSMP